VVPGEYDIGGGAPAGRTALLPIAF